MTDHAKLIPTPKSLAPILGGSLEAVQTRTGKTKVNLRRLCDSIGANFDAEFARLDSLDCGWATVEEMTVRVVNRSQDLATIDPDTVKPGVRKKLEQFQHEANAVLDAWFDVSRKERLVPDQKAVRQSWTLETFLEGASPKPDAKPRRHELGVLISPGG